MIVHEIRAGRIHVGDWREADLSSGYTLAIVDGPYAMGMAAWDRMKLDDLAEWYRPHLARVSKLCAASASVYLWNTAQGHRRLDAVMREMGWTHRGDVTWQKTNPASQKGVKDRRAWPDVTEVCAFYQREAWAPNTCAGQEISYAAGADERNWIRLWLAEEWTSAGLRRYHADHALGTNGMSGHYFGASQWSLPTWDNYRKLADYAQKHGPHRERPYLVHPSVWPGGDLRASYDHLRPAFALPVGVTNVWTAPLVGGADRLKGPDGAALHPCQKPILFAERMIRASTRPGERILVPFGGTCREAVVCEWLARAEPEEARKYDVCELNADGVDYIGPVLAQIRGESSRGAAPGQVRMFANSDACHGRGA